MNDLFLIHRNDVEWNMAPLPRRLHLCTPWTEGFVNGRHIERCACGAIRLDRFWMEKNVRRKYAK